MIVFKMNSDGLLASAVILKVLIYVCIANDSRIRIAVCYCTNSNRENIHISHFRCVNLLDQVTCIASKPNAIGIFFNATVRRKLPDSFNRETFKEFIQHFVDATLLSCRETIIN